MTILNSIHTTLDADLTVLRFEDTRHQDLNTHLAIITSGLTLNNLEEETHSFEVRQLENSTNLLTAQNTIPQLTSNQRFLVYMHTFGFDQEISIDRRGFIRHNKKIDHKGISMQTYLCEDKLQDNNFVHHIGHNIMHPWMKGIECSAVVFHHIAKIIDLTEDKSMRYEIRMLDLYNRHCSAIVYMPYDSLQYNYRSFRVACNEGRYLEDALVFTNQLPTIYDRRRG